MLPESHNLAKWIGGEGIHFFFLLSEKKIYLLLFISKWSAEDSRPLRCLSGPGFFYFNSEREEEKSTKGLQLV